MLSDSKINAFDAAGYPVLGLRRVPGFSSEDAKKLMGLQKKSGHGPHTLWILDLGRDVWQETVTRTAEDGTPYQTVEFRTGFADRGLVLQYYGRTCAQAVDAAEKALGLYVKKEKKAKEGQAGAEG